MKKILILLTALLLIAILGCKSSFQISETNYQEHQFQVVTADDGYSLEMPTVYDALYNSKLLNLGGVLDTNLVRDFIDSIVIDTMIGIEATEVNLGDYYHEHRVFKNRYNEIILKQYFKEMVYDKAKSDSLEVVEYYNSNEKMFAIEEQVNLYHIGLHENTLLKGEDSLKYSALSKEELENELFKYADSIKSLITSPEKFPEIASKFSEDVDGAKGGGYLGWTKRGTYPNPFDSIAFELRDGQIGGPYSDGAGVHIIMIDDHHQAGLQPLNEHLYLDAKKTLETTKSNSIGLKLLKSLLDDFDVLVNPEIAEKDLYTIDGKIWGAIINSIDTIDCNETRYIESKFREKYHVKNSTPEMKIEIFKELGKRYVIIQAARKIGIEEDSVVTYEREKLNHKYTRSIVSKRRFDIRWTPTDSMMEKYYKEHLDDFEVFKPYKVQHIIVEDSLFGEFLRDQAMSGIDFMELAEEHYPGVKSIRNDLADLGFIGEKDVSKEFYEVAAATRAGEVSHPVKTEFGYHIIKVLEIKNSLTFEEAKRVIIQVLKKEYKTNSVSTFKNDLFSKYNVQATEKLYPVHLKPKSLRK